ncbi:excisionase family DNA-binding protein [Halalkalibacterium ligniniphilum]|uniref:excisionase family DNA-binding protein n=1 Tax=Halalkalibacterium ligniniphilum TaxID=1134413 RepID=UPI00034D41B9|nr:excisionase family DNA-binding protein [Halalkalibacterium ligniniphilum]
MYVTVKELSEYLGLSVDYLQEQIRLGHIKAIHDGEKFLVNKKQFEWHKEKLEERRKEVVALLEEPMPEDWDAKDED